MTAKQRARRTPPSKPASKPAAPTTAHVPIAKLRKLAAALERDGLPAGIPEEIQAVSAQLAELGERAQAGAAAVLGHTEAGSPVARAYLAVVGDPGDGALAAADVVARYCATMTQGRKLLRPAFLATWRRAEDTRAVEAAWKNLAKIAIDDPALLAVAAETARRLGQAAALADHTARIERAERLAPLVAGLAGSGARRAKATQQLAALDTEDRRQVYARVVDQPREFDKALAITAVAALVDDRRAPDMALAAAVFEMPAASKAQLVAAWQPRVIEGDEALIVRLLALFEWTGLWATDDEPFEPYIRALAPAGRHPDVFAQVESGLASDKACVREAILGRWLGDAGAFAAFTEAQADTLMRSAIAIAEVGATTPEQRAAHDVVSQAGAGRPGVHRALIDGLRHANPRKSGELRASLYRGLARVAHPDATAFLVDRLFTERAAYDELTDAVAAQLDGELHGQLLRALADRRADAGALHAAALYADALLEKRRSARLLGDVARAILTWQPSNADDKRRLRYVLEQATLAAIAVKQARDARAFLARARAFEVAPYSDFQVVARDRKTPAAFAEPAGKKLLAQLEIGAIDKDLAVAREAAEAARAAATPIAADDDRLGALTGSTTVQRWLDDRDSHEVWFFDELGELHVYDGYDVELPAFQITGSPDRGIAADALPSFLAGRRQLDERIVLGAPAKRDRIREIIRLGDRVVVLDGMARPKDIDLTVAAIGLRFADPAAARAAVARLAAYPPKGTQPLSDNQVPASAALGAWEARIRNGGR